MFPPVGLWLEQTGREGFPTVTALLLGLDEQEKKESSEGFGLGLRSRNPDFETSAADAPPYHCDPQGIVVL